MIDPVNRASATKGPAVVGSPHAEPHGASSAAAAAVAPPAAVAARPAAKSAPIIADMVDAGPPVDSARVAELRQKIADGSYPIDADRFAWAMIAQSKGSGE